MFLVERIKKNIRLFFNLTLFLNIDTPFFAFAVIDLLSVKKKSTQAKKKRIWQLKNLHNVLSIFLCLARATERIRRREKK